MNEDRRTELHRLAEEVMDVVLTVAARRLVQCTEEIHVSKIKPLREVLKNCQTLTPSLLDGEAAKERLRQINCLVYDALGVAPTETGGVT